MKKFSILTFLAVSGSLVSSRSLIVEPAGLGLELECNSFKFKNNGIVDGTVKPATPDEREDVKGKAFMIVTDNPKDHELKNKAANDLLTKDKSTWELTAELISGGNVDFIRGEFIINGKTLKVANGDARAVGAEIIKFYDTWKPEVGKDLIELSGTTTGGQTLTKRFGEWTVMNAPSKGILSCGLQVTTALAPSQMLPLPADLKILRGKNYDKIVALTEGQIGKCLKGVEKLSKDASATLSFILSFAKVGVNENPASGPKQSLSIMPRTDFSTIFNAFAKSEIQKKFKADCQHLAGLAKTTDYLTNNEMDATFKWDTHHLKVSDWFDGLDKDKDLVSQYDKEYRHGQIGGLKSRMEMTGASPSPIWEFRDLNDLILGKFDDGFADIQSALKNTYAHPSISNTNEGEQVVLEL